MEEIYKGYKIEYNIHCQVFYANIGDSGYSNSDLEKVRKHIDDLDKKDFKRVNVLCGMGWRRDNISKVIVTSEFNEGKDTYAWVTNESKSRSKHNIKYLYEYCDENLDKVQTIKEIDEKIKALESHRSEVFNSMIKYKSQIPEVQNATSK